MAQPLASLHMWSTVADCRSCQVVVFESGCTVDMHSYGEHVFSRSFPSLPEALTTAEGLRRLHVTSAPRLAKTA